MSNNVTVCLHQKNDTAITVTGVKRNGRSVMIGIGGKFCEEMKYDRF